MYYSYSYMSFSLLHSYPMNSSYMFFSFPMNSFSIPFFLSHSHPMNFSMYSFSSSRFPSLYSLFIYSHEWIYQTSPEFALIPHGFY